jgi:hypothetical protein
MAFLTEAANRGSIATGYEIENSCKFEADNTESLTKAAATGGDRKKATLSLWCKRTELTNSEQVILFLTGANGNKYTSLGWGTGDEINFHYYNSGTYPYNFLTDREFRDTSAWYHIVVAVDTTQSTASDRVKFYVNGVQETSFSTEVYPDQNIDTPFNNDSATYPMEIGNDTVFSMGGEALSGYLADYYLIDGQQLAPTEFGEFDEDSGIWIPKAYTGTFGSNGFYLDFADASDLGDDESGNGNDFTEVNITAADQATDTPTNNFCTLNAESARFKEASGTTEGGTTYYAQWSSQYAVYGLMASTFGVSNGKWYWEVTNTWTSGNAITGTGAMRYDNPNYDAFLSGTDGGISYWYSYAANLIYYFDGSAQTNVAYSNLPIASSGDVISIALDMDNGKIYFGLNGTWRNSSNPATGSNPVSLPSNFITGAYTPTATIGSAGIGTGFYNFGGYTEATISSAETDANGYGTFEYAPPSGYYALCTKNLAEFG